MERPQPDSMPQDLSEALKEATKEVHTQAENAEFMRNFQKGQVTRDGFKLFEELQELLTHDTKDQSPSRAPGLRQRASNKVQDSAPVETPRGKPPLNTRSQAPLLRWVLTLSFLVATVAVGLYAM
uniref:Heme oxygenase 1 n=1 Tax=Homo sapiens TaxID=9606 RepID=A0A7I2V277_HUMAN